ncbi:hypothetical protein HL653_18240 [Sphingomonas sp. AP4-R1]|uniref:hypothetical protein n=1 Tax=Sphingomonas sp. AP4-R1 TaxID=2735134 RepID=UPI00149398EC|nr:hypothetical protein [Sphingomonas sp. AP4-R1]QJU59435.1 hypothetical protein HL653_18240 [Sphingomonas sp. AP4-R1]
MIDPSLIVEEFTASLGTNLLTAFVVALVMLGAAMLMPARWRMWAAFSLAVAIGLCLTIAFILVGLRVLNKVGLAFPVQFGPIHLVLAILLSGAAFALIRRQRGARADTDMPKPDDWYDRPPA